MVGGFDHETQQGRQGQQAAGIAVSPDDDLQQVGGGAGRR